jgi:hypothetical protein
MIHKINPDNSNELKELNSFLMNQDYSLLYVSKDYISLLENYLANTATELWVFKNVNNEIIGYLPIMFRFNLAYGTICNSMPFYGSNGGITVSNTLTSEEKNRVRHELMTVALQSITEKKCVSYTFITNPLDAEFNEWIASNLSYQLKDERIGQLTPLPHVDVNEVEKALLDLFEDPRPRNIRKALKENITVYSSHTDEAFDFLYKTHFENITSINGIPKEKKFFDTVKNSFPKEGYKLYIAEKEGEKLGALLLFYFNKTVEYYTPAVVEKHRNLQASSLLIYKAMIDAVGEGYSWWNWGGTWLSQGGVYDFKKKWGTKDLHYFYYTVIPDNKILNNTKEVLLKEYPFFFVAPFNKLKN